MALPQGIYFRSTDNQTDPTNCDADTATTLNYPTTSAQGNNVGYESRTFANSAADRDVTTDVRLKGIHYVSKTETVTYRIDVPSAGSYNTRIAIGDSGFGHPLRCQIIDGTTTLSDCHAASSGNEWIDATNVARTSESNWVNNNALFATTLSGAFVRFKFGATTDSHTDANTTWNFVYIEAAGGSAAATYPQLERGVRGLHRGVAGGSYH